MARIIHEAHAWTGDVRSCGRRVPQARARRCYVRVISTLAAAAGGLPPLSMLKFPVIVQASITGNPTINPDSNVPSMTPQLISLGID